jgi:hypothetical protein
VSSSLNETQQASLQKAVELAQQYAAKPSTAAIRDYLIGLLEQVGGSERRYCCTACTV